MFQFFRHTVHHRETRGRKQSTHHSTRGRSPLPPSSASAAIEAAAAGVQRGLTRCRCGCGAMSMFLLEAAVRLDENRDGGCTNAVARSRRYTAQTAAPTAAMVVTIARIDLSQKASRLKALCLGSDRITYEVCSRVRRWHLKRPRTPPLSLLLQTTQLSAPLPAFSRIGRLEACGLQV